MILLRALPQLRRSLPRDRVFVSIGLWGRDGAMSPGDLARAVAFTLDGGMPNLWITPNHLLTPAHWEALASVLGRPGG